MRLLIGAFLLAISYAQTGQSLTECTQGAFSWATFLTEPDCWWMVYSGVYSLDPCKMDSCPCWNAVFDGTVGSVTDCFVPGISSIYSPDTAFAHCQEGALGDIPVDIPVDMCPEGVKDYTRESYDLFDTVGEGCTVSTNDAGDDCVSPYDPFLDYFQFSGWCRVEVTKKVNLTADCDFNIDGDYDTLSFSGKEVYSRSGVPQSMNISQQIQWSTSWMSDSHYFTICFEKYQDYQTPPANVTIEDQCPSFELTTEELIIILAVLGILCLCACCCYGCYSIIAQDDTKSGYDLRDAGVQMGTTKN